MRISDWISDVCSSDLIFRQVDEAARDGQRVVLITFDEAAETFVRIEVRVAVATVQDRSGIEIGNAVAHLDVEIVERQRELADRFGQNGTDDDANRPILRRFGLESSFCTTNPEGRNAVGLLEIRGQADRRDRKSTRLNSSH